MMVFISYDIADPRRLQQVHKFLKDYGLNTQKSIFECQIDAAILLKIKRGLAKLVDIEDDSVRIYKLCQRCAREIVISGQGLKLLNFDYKVI